MEESCKKTAGISVAAKAPSETASLLNINALPNLPFRTLFEWIPLCDLLSIQLVCHKWKEATAWEASTHRDSITLCIDGQAEDQKTVRYLERSVWNLPHAEKLKTDDGKPLYPDYVPPSQRSTWDNLLLGTRLENPIQLHETLQTAQEHQQWQANYDRSFETLLDQKVSQLLTLFPRGPRTLTIVCRSQHTDFLRLIPLLANWKENLVTLNLYSSHPRALDGQQQELAVHYGSFHINHPSNRPLLAVLNSMSSLRHLTLDLLGEEGDTLNDSADKSKLSIELRKSGELDHRSDFRFFHRLESFTFADLNSRGMIQNLIFCVTSSSSLQIGNSFSDYATFRIYVPSFNPSSSFCHLHLQPFLRDSGPTSPSDMATLASLSSLFLNWLHTLPMSLSFLLQYLIFTVGLVHLRLHLTGEHVTRWFDEMDSLREEQLSSLPRLRVLSLILVDNQPIDHRLPSLFQRLFPSLQVIVLHQRLIGTQPQQPTQFLESYLTSIKRHFSETHFPESLSFLLLEARLFLYQEPNRHNFGNANDHIWGFGAHVNLLQSKEDIWSVEELRATFIQ